MPRFRERVKTWQFELAAVAAVLSGVVIATGAAPVEWLGAAAVTLTFAHAQVADRLAENEQERQSYVRDEVAQRYSVSCHAWATRYLVTKECLWLVYFVLHHSWSALAGVGLFLAYPVWRKWWRKKHPRGRNEPVIAV